MVSIPRRTSTQQQHDTGGRAGVHRTPFAAATAVLALVVLAGCGSSGGGAGAGSGGSATSSSSPSATSAATTGSTTSSAAPTTPHATATIRISGYKYTVPASVAPGATVSVMNMDAVNHTVTADKGGAFDVKSIAGMTTTFVAPSTPGSYPFHCIYHANMHGVLVVK